MSFVANTKLKKGTVSARVYRAATGKWENLGVIASTSKWFNFKQGVKKWLTTRF